MDENVTLSSAVLQLQVAIQNYAQVVSETQSKADVETAASFVRQMTQSFVSVTDEVTAIRASPFGAPIHSEPANWNHDDGRRFVISAWYEVEVHADLEPLMRLARERLRIKGQSVAEIVAWSAPGALRAIYSADGWDPYAYRGIVELIKGGSDLRRAVE